MEVSWVRVPGIFLPLLHLYAPTNLFGGHYVFPLSVRPSIRTSVRPEKCSPFCKVRNSTTDTPATTKLGQYDQQLADIRKQHMSCDLYLTLTYFFRFIGLVVLCTKWLPVRGGIRVLWTHF